MPTTKHAPRFLLLDYNLFTKKKKAAFENVTVVDCKHLNWKHPPFSKLESTNANVCVFFFFLSPFFA